MKSLRLLVALSALLVVGSTTAAQAQSYGGRVLLPAAQTESLNPPIGVNETGRYMRFVTDPRFQENQIQMSNRDFENWKPLDARSKEKMTHFMRGNLRTTSSPVADQETGRFMRFVVDNRLDYNNVNMENRDFQNFKVNGAESKTFMMHYLHGLPTGRGYVAPRSLAVRGESLPIRWY